MALSKYNFVWLTIVMQHIENISKDVCSFRHLVEFDKRVTLLVDPPENTYAYKVLHPKKKKKRKKKKATKAKKGKKGKAVKVVKKVEEEKEKPPE